LFRKKSSWLSLALHLGDYSFGGGGLKKQKILGIVMIYCKKWYNKAKLNVLGENMNFIQEKQIEINLGLSGRYTLMQFNDVHLATFDRDKDDLETINRAISQERIWMSQRIDFAANSTNFCFGYPAFFRECLERLIDYAIKNRPDLVIMAGDIVDYYSKSNWDFLVQAVSRLESPYLFSCGNHESPADFLRIFARATVIFRLRI
jgi:predicted MPP superfamily phosphohydrolase